MSADNCNEHELKCWPAEFWAIRDDRKFHEFRKNDRGFAIGNVLLLREWDPKAAAYSGRYQRVQVTHMTHGPHFGVPDGYVVMSVRKVGP